MEEIIVPIIVIPSIFLGLPWLILHYVTKWKSTATLPVEDERLLDELYDTARRLEDRLHTVERIIAADNPDWRPSVRSDRMDDPRLEANSDRFARTDRTDRSF
jgi:phage shock protein B